VCARACVCVCMLFSLCVCVSVFCVCVLEKFIKQHDFSVCSNIDTSLSAQQEKRYVVNYRANRRK